MKFPSREIVERVRREYHTGTRVELIRMVTGVDDTASIMVRWDNGNGLHVVYGEDECRKL